MSASLVALNADEKQQFSIRRDTWNSPPASCSGTCPPCSLRLNCAERLRTCIKSHFSATASSLTRPSAPGRHRRRPRTRTPAQDCSHPFAPPLGYLPENKRDWRHKKSWRSSPCARCRDPYHGCPPPETFLPNWPNLRLDSWEVLRRGGNTAETLRQIADKLKDRRLSRRESPVKRRRTHSNALCGRCRDPYHGCPPPETFPQNWPSLRLNSWKVRRRGGKTAKSLRQIASN
jgi:hypothetical protein